MSSEPLPLDVVASLAHGGRPSPSWVERLAAEVLDRRSVDASRDVDGAVLCTEVNGGEFEPLAQTYKPEGVRLVHAELARLRTRVAETEAEINRLAAWKAEAMTSLNEWHSLERDIPRSFSQRRLARSWPSVVSDYIRHLKNGGR